MVDFSSHTPAHVPLVSHLIPPATIQYKKCNLFSIKCCWQPSQFTISPCPSRPFLPRSPAKSTHPLWNLNPPEEACLWQLQQWEKWLICSWKVNSGSVEWFLFARHKSAKASDDLCHCPPLRKHLPKSYSGLILKFIMSKAKGFHRNHTLL